MMPEPAVIQEIRRSADPVTFPDGSSYLSLSLDRTAIIAQHFGLAGAAVELAALKGQIVPERYARNMKALSFEEQAALLEARVCIVGLGGLGGVVCEILARMGVGTLGLIDGDSFDESNLNRQFLSTEDRIGASKTKAALTRVRNINSSIAVFGYHEFLDETKAVQRIRSFTVVADCLDNIRTRFELERAAKSAGIPLVSGAVSGASGQVTVIFPEDTGFQSIYGKAEKSPIKGSETTLGCLPFAVTLIGSIECSEIVKIILKKGSHFRNKLFIAELMDNVFETFQL